MKTKRLFGILTACSLVFSALPALAEPSACKADREKLCQGVGRGEMRECFKKNQDLLSPGCKTFLQEKRAQRQAMKQACSADREKFCGNLGSEKGKVRECMKAHKSELSATCREKIDALKKWKTSQHSTWEGLKAVFL